MKSDRRGALVVVMSVAVYVSAVAAANLLVSAYGPSVSILNALLLVGLVLAVRDRLHLAWAGSPSKMLALIAAGGAVSALVSPASARIAAASCVAFVVSEVADYIAFSRMRGSWFRRSSGSNVAGAAVDSFAFPILAFGAFMPWIVAGQFAAKVVGGLVFSWLIFRARRVTVAALLLAACAAPARASDWLVDIGAGGVAVSDGYSAPVVELFVATPPAHGFRAYAIASSDIGSGGDPIDTAIVAVTRGWFAHGKLLALNAGVSGFGFEDFAEAHPFIGATIGIPLRKRTAIVLTGSVDAETGSASCVAKITFSLLR